MMNIVDTNVLARFFIDDENDSESIKQKQIAIKILSNPVFVPITVILEFEWVMRGFYHLEKSIIIKIFNILIQSDTIFIEDNEIVIQAVKMLEQGFDFADALHILRSHEHDTFITFDKKFFKKSQQLSLDITLANSVK